MLKLIPFLARTPILEGRVGANGLEKTTVVGGLVAGQYMPSSSSLHSLPPSLSALAIPHTHGTYFGMNYATATLLQHPKVKPVRRLQELGRAAGVSQGRVDGQQRPTELKHELSTLLQPHHYKPKFGRVGIQPASALPLLIATSHHPHFSISTRVCLGLLLVVILRIP